MNDNPTTESERLCMEFAGRVPPEVEPDDDEQTWWPGHIALESSLLLTDMKRGMKITQASIDCIDMAIEKLEAARDIIKRRKENE